MNSRQAIKPTHEIELSPAFYDIDSMEVVYHGHYVKYLEQARSALLDKYGYGYKEMKDSGYLWPIVDMRLKYVRPATLGQRLRVKATVTEWENRLRIEYVMRDASSGEKINTAYTIQVALNAVTREMCFVCPPVLAECLGVLP